MQPSTVLSPSPVATGWLALWLAIQLGALGLAASQLPLSDNHPRPAQRLAAQIVSTAQVSAAAMLFPRLLRSAGQTLVVASAAWPMLFLGGVLSGTGLKELVWAGAYLTLLLGGLHLAARRIRCERYELVFASLLSLWTLGGAALMYLATEFERDALDNGVLAVWLRGPLLAVLDLLRGQRPSLSLFAPPLALAAAAGLGGLVIWLRARWRPHRASPLP